MTLNQVANLNTKTRRDHFTEMEEMRRASRQQWLDEIKSLNPEVIDEVGFDALSETEQQGYVYRGMGIYYPRSIGKLQLPRLKGRTRYLYW